MPSSKRYALVGTGIRAQLYIDALASQSPEMGLLVGLADVSRVRMDYYNRRIREKFSHGEVPTFHSDDFDRMIRQTRAHVVIVTSPDATHHQYITRAMELGCDVICEKPMTTDGDKLRAIFDAIDRTGRSLRVTFNYRYAPTSLKMKEIVESGEIGRPTAVDFSWTLDTSHGADYFRRWHRLKDQSGGLLIHKATHHFDAINWWIDSYPARVFAIGDLMFYGRRAAQQRGESYAYDRYTGHADAQRDPFAIHLDENPTLRELYLDAEQESGYIRDRNVFNDDITIEDTMAITARFRNGVILNYSLLAYSPWEGVRVAITGTRGRVEMYERRHVHIAKGQSAGADVANDGDTAPIQSIRLFPMFGAPQDVKIPELVIDHGLYDPALMRDLFAPDSQPRRHRQCIATHIDGAASALVGICANQSMATGLPVECDDVLKLPKKQKSEAPKGRASVTVRQPARSLAGQRPHPV